MKKNWIKASGFSEHCALEKKKKKRKKVLKAAEYIPQRLPN